MVMGTLLKYIFYIIIILLIYLVAKDIYDGKINQDTTVREMGTTLEQQSQKIVKDGVATIEKESQKEIKKQSIATP